MFQTFDFAFVECCVGTNYKGMEGNPQKINTMNDVNDDELGLSSYVMVLEVNETSNFFIEL